MQLAIWGDKIFIKNNRDEYAIVKGLPNSKFNKKMKAWEVPATLDMLNRLGSIVKLPVNLEQERERLLRKQAAIDAARMEEDPVPIMKYPVKVNLFKHQIRAANMAMFALELVNF